MPFPATPPPRPSERAPGCEPAAWRALTNGSSSTPCSRWPRPTTRSIAWPAVSPATISWRPWSVRSSGPPTPGSTPVSAWAPGSDSPRTAATSSSPPPELPAGWRPPAGGSCPERRARSRPRSPAAPALNARLDQLRVDLLRRRLRIVLLDQPPGPHDQRHDAIAGHVLEPLDETRDRPAHRHLVRAGRLAQAAMQPQRALGGVAVSRRHLAQLPHPAGLHLHPRSHRVAVGSDAGQLDLQPVAAQPDLVAQQRVPPAVGGHRQVQRPAVPEIRRRHAPAVGQQVGAGAAADLLEGAVAIVAQVPVALPPVPRPLAEVAWVEEQAGLVVALAADHVVEKLELDLGAALAVHPAVGAVEVEPAVVVEVREHRPPEPAGRIGARRDADVLEGAVAAVAQQVVAGRHLAEDLDEVEPRLAEDLPVQRHVAAPHPLLPGVRQVPAHRRRRREPGVLRADVGGVEVEQPIVVVVRERSAHARAIGERAGGDRDVLEGAVAVVVVQRAAAEVVAHEEVGITFVVVVAPGAPQAEPGVADAGPVGDVGEGAVT